MKKIAIYALFLSILAGSLAAQNKRGAVENTAPPDTATAVIRSSPSSADITIDGKFVGSTPATFRLAIGDHTLLIEKPGFKKWQRTLTILGGPDANVEANLEKLP